MGNGLRPRLLSSRHLPLVWQAYLSSCYHHHPSLSFDARLHQPFPFPSGCYFLRGIALATEIGIENRIGSESGKENESETHPSANHCPCDRPRSMRRRTKNRGWKSFCFDSGCCNCGSFRFRGFGHHEIDCGCHGCGCGNDDRRGQVDESDGVCLHDEKEEDFCPPGETSDGEAARSCRSDCLCRVPTDREELLLLRGDGGRPARHGA
jgi:hypothetical protein